jgi:hypothetical protein
MRGGLYGASGSSSALNSMRSFQAGQLIVSPIEVAKDYSSLISLSTGVGAIG